MRIARLAAAGTAALVVAGCADGRAALGPSTREAGHHPSELAASAASRIETSGSFVALVDFSTLTLTPRGSNCRLEVDGRLVFTGTIEGTAIGHTSALVFAPCSEVATTPPGTYPDVFRSELEFEGTIGGVPAEAGMLYEGRVEPGGRIGGRLLLSRGASGRLDVEARVAVGGEYGGSAVVH